MANKPNNPSLWSKAKSMARQKFDVYPSAYANGWAAKYYKSKGGTWRKGEQGMYMKDGGKMFAQSGMAKPIYTSNPNDPRIRRFNDSLSLNNLTRAYEPMFMRNPYDERLENYNTIGGRISTRSGIKPTRVRTEYNEYAVGRDFEPRLMEQAYLAKFKRPVQPVKYADPKIVEKQKILKDAGLYSGDLDGIWGPKSEEAFKKYEESKATPTSTVSRETAPRVSSTPAVKRSGPIYQRWGQMTNPEIRRKAIKKYGDPSKFPLQGVDITTLKNGGKVSVKAGGENHVVYKKQTKQGKGKPGNIMVNHPTMDKGKWDTIDLTQKAGAKTVAQGVAATKKWHKENPYPKNKMQMGGMTPAQQAAKKLAMNMKGKVVGSDRMLKSGGNTFKPKFQIGGQPTFADSARLYNAQINLNNFYNNEVRKGRLRRPISNPFYSFLYTQPQLRNQNLAFYREDITNRNKNRGKGVYDDVYKKLFGFTPAQVAKLEAQGLGQTKAGNANQEYYRDIITPLQNLASPFALVDYRIKPDREINYVPVNRENYPGGAVTVYDYDPLRIKPYRWRTPAEKIAWEKKYGKPKSATSTSISLTPRTSSSSRTTTGSTGTSAREAESESILPPMSGTPTASSTSRTTSTPTTSIPTTSRETAPAPPATPAVKGSAPILQRWQNMNADQKRKAVAKYGDPSTWPFQGVDVRGFKKGGKTSKLKQAYFNKYK